MELLRSRCGLGQGRSVLDLGAGTGKMTVALLDTGAEVLALEPLSEMRASLASNAPYAEVIGGSAEAIPLRHRSLDAVVCAQAFHWFRAEVAGEEIHRILKPGRILALVWNVRDEEDPLQAEISRIIEPFRGETPSHRDRGWVEPLRAGGRFAEPSVSSFPWVQIVDLGGLVDRVTSISFIAALPEPGRLEVTEAIRKLGASRSAIPLPYRTDVYLYERLP